MVNINLVRVIDLDLLKPFLINIFVMSLMYRYYGKVKEKKFYAYIIIGSFIGVVLWWVYKSIL